ncbi:MAG: hypothetical protein ABSC29_02900 [Minisyncoccia bacterium]|jgi:hypothetical protein
MKKITVLKDEGIAEVIDRVLEEPGDEVVVVIPKESALGRSMRNFHLLKREADAAGKTVTIESVDENILAFAKESGLEGSHPLWRGTGGVADIVPANEEAGEDPAPKKRSRKKTEPVKLTVHKEEEESDEEAAKEAETFEEEEGRFFKKRSAPEMGEENEEEEEPRRGVSHKLVWGGIIAVVIVFAALGIITWSFGHVNIAIDFQKTPWNYEGSVVAGKSIATSTANGAVISIHAAVFSLPKNTTQLFPASGNANVSIKAQGTITIYNAYSSAKQDLVASTRFVTPDGKLFRLVNNVTVPGAQVTNGQIVPSSIDAPAVADQAGTSYNVGPVDKLTIPGFQGSPKYNAFYGQLKSGTSGGFVGKRAVPTAADIASAKTKVTAVLQANLTSDLTTRYPDNFKILDGATSAQVTKLTANTSTDASGNFSVFGEASLQAIGFDESVLKAFLLSLASEGRPDFVWNSFTQNYSGVHADFAKGTVSFSLSALGTLTRAFDENAFKASIAGKSIGDARTAIAAIPGLTDGKISAWPVWLWSIPSNPNKVQITAN